MADQPAAAPRRVRPFPFDRLPRIARNQVEAGRSFRAHLPLAIGASFAEVERGLGPVRFRLLECFVARARDLEALLAGIVVRVVAPGEHWGLVVIDRALAVALAGRALGIDRAVSPELPAPRPPTLAETGVIELLVQLLVEEPVQVVGVVEPDELLGLLGTLLDDAMVHVLSAWVTSAVGNGAARLIVPQAMALAAAPARPRPASLRRRARLDVLRFSVALERARVAVARGLLSDLRVGDVLTFDVPSHRGASELPLSLRFGRGAFSAVASNDRIVLIEPFRIHQGAAPMSPEPTRTADDSSTDQLLRELPVEIVCELGRVSMSGRELLELEPGAVIPIPRPLAGPIDLTVGGRVIARGELVDVEGDLGVRLTEIVD